MLIATVVWSNSFQSPSCSNTGQPVLNNSQNTPKNQFLPKSDWPMASMFYKDTIKYPLRNVRSCNAQNGPNNGLFEWNSSVLR